MLKIGCVAIVRNEERHIAEWLAWQFLIGFDTVFLLDNGSTDATAEVARRFAPSFDVRMFAFPSTAPDRQVAGYERVTRAVANDYEWLAFFDTDEFLVLEEGLSLKGLLAARPEAAIALPWAVFGSNGHEDMPGDLVTEAFTRRASAEFPPNCHVKTILRPKLMVSGYNPHVFKVQGHYVDLTGRPVVWHHVEGYLGSPPDFTGGKLHHYFTRSKAQWRAKQARGYPDGTVRTDEDFTGHDRNEIEDLSAAARAPLLRTLLARVQAPPQAPAPPAFEPAPAAPETTAALYAPPAVPAIAEGAKLGIAITTYNRKELVLALIARLRDLTTTSYALVVCDDGSTDGTKEALRADGVTVIGGTNRGIAWNKNRGLYYLLHVARCDAVVLLDDDVEPETQGWERDWFQGALRFGHVNHAHPSYAHEVVAGKGTAEEPALARVISGWVLAFSAATLAQIGYFDPRFGRYGHEHSDLSFRAVRAGFGGIKIGREPGAQTLFYTVQGGVRGIPMPSSGTPEELEVNARLLAQSGHEPAYRHAWRDDAERVSFIAEIAEALPIEVQAGLMRSNHFPTLEAHLTGCPPVLGAPELLFLLGKTPIEMIDAALARGGRVIAVQPEARRYTVLIGRYDEAIEAGRVVVENALPAALGGKIVLYQPPEGGRPYHVPTVSGAELVARHGRPVAVWPEHLPPGFTLP